MVEEVESEKELEEILESPQKVVVFYFWKDCGHCKAMHGPYNSLAEDHKDTKFVKVETKNIPKKLNKNAFPEFELREKGEVKAKAGGQMTKEQLNAQLFGGKLGGRRRRTRSRRLRRRTRKSFH